jgi:hypothetical protein
MGRMSYRRALRLKVAEELLVSRTGMGETTGLQDVSGSDWSSSGWRQA